MARNGGENLRDAAHVIPNDSANVFLDIFKATLPFLRLSTVGNLLLLLGHFILLGNLIALAVRYYRARAAAIYRTARRRRRKVVTTNYVLVELVALLTSPLRISRPAVVTIIEDVKGSPFVEVIHVDPTLGAEAWNLLRSRQDKEWSLVDCASFVLMTRRGIQEALTTDHHFDQAGFVQLLK